jgi:D-lactate dehydrogenase
MLTAVYKKLLNDFLNYIPEEQIFTYEFQRYALGTDAGFYRLVPKIVVKVESEKEVIQVIKSCRSKNIPLTFRAAGTSLSGQAISDSILVILGENWDTIDIEDEGHKVKVQPGIIGERVNIQLSRFNRKLGPDPASINAAKMGGIAANNASGMTSGTANNIYNTLEGMRIIFSNGSILDSTNDESINHFKEYNQNLLDRISAIANNVKSNEELKKRIEHKYKIKNTCGYGLNSLIDFDDPIDIITHLMIGSEGTLGFISDITLRTVPDLPYKATALLFLDDIASACSMIPVLEKLPVDAAELMDRSSIRLVEGLKGVPEKISLLDDEAAALLIETSANSEAELNSNVDLMKVKFSVFAFAANFNFTTNAVERLLLWNVRKGLFPSVCKNRESGTTVIIEDLNFHTEDLSNAILDLKELLHKFSYTDSFIWGHALSGNIHFVITPKFDTQDEITRYDKYMKEIAKLVIDKYDGSLKAEHGTGRNMAPFVQYEWGKELYNIMKDIKEAFDPNNILNPGVLINDDENIHLKNLKAIPIANEKIDKCTECGFCESTCPSKDFTLTPRQRIVTIRKLAAENKPFKITGIRAYISKQINYSFESTCAVDGLCEISCPVDINVGNLVKDYRSLSHGKFSLLVASLFANNFGISLQVIRGALKITSFFRSVFGEKILEKVSKLLSAISLNKIPQWNKFIPISQSRLTLTSEKHEKQVVYLPSCTNRIFGKYANDEASQSIFSSVNRVLSSAGYNLIVPPNLNNLCCGLSFESKGYIKQSLLKSEELYSSLMAISNKGQYPILFDTSPCALHFKEHVKSRNKNSLQLYDPIEYIYEKIIDKVELQKIDDTIALHPVCSSKKAGNSDQLVEIAQQCAKKVVVTEGIDCCGFAGDRGFNFPELNRSALQKLPAEISEKCKTGYSTSRTCEIGLSKNSGVYFNSIFNLIDKSIVTDKSGK